MRAGTQCDNCRVFGPRQAPGWFYVAQQPRDEESPAIAALSALLGNPSEPLTFCTIRCLAEWAYVRNAATEAAAGSEPS